MRNEKTLQEIIIRERLKTGHQTVCKYEPCRHCGVLVMGAHDCPILNGEGEERLRRVRRFILFVSLRKKAEEEARKLEGNRKSNVKRFGLYRRSA